MIGLLDIPIQEIKLHHDIEQSVEYEFTENLNIRYHLSAYLISYLINNSLLSEFNKYFYNFKTKSYIYKNLNLFRVLHIEATRTVTESL